MSDNAFDPHGEPRQPRSADSTKWRGFDPGGQVSAPPSVSPPRARPRNPYAPPEDADPRQSSQHPSAPPRPRSPSDRPSAAEAPAQWPPMIAPSPPRVGAGLRLFEEPGTQESPAVRPRGSRPRDPVTSENATIGRRPPSPYREYATGDNTTVPRPASPPPGPPPTPQPRPGPPPGHPAAPQPRPGPPPGHPTAPQPRPGPPPGHPTAPQPRPGPPPGHPAAPQPRPGPPGPPGPPPGQRPPTSPDTTHAHPAPGHPGPPTATTSTIDQQPRPFHEPPTAETPALRPEPSPPRQMSPTQRPIHVEPDSGPISGTLADPPWQSRRAAEEDASFISPLRVLATVGVIVMVITMAGAVIWGLNLYGDRF